MLADCICYHRRELIGMDEMYRNLTLQMLLATVLGILLAKAFGSPQWLTSPNVFYDVIVMVKVSFLAALKMLIAPMIFFSLISGISNIGNAPCRHNRVSTGDSTLMHCPSDLRQT